MARADPAAERDATMKWMFAIFAVVFLIVVDQTQFHGYHLDQIARVLSRIAR
jgi:hypothetical protein